MYAAQFTEYKYELRYANGAPKDAIFFYECCKYPGYYIRWYCKQYAVNCEVIIFNLQRAYVIILTIFPCSPARVTGHIRLNRNGKSFSSTGYKLKILRAPCNTAG